jgi:hypothetical protein
MVFIHGVTSISWLFENVMGINKVLFHGIFMAFFMVLCSWVFHEQFMGLSAVVFAVNILQITTSSMGYVLFIFTHCVHACEHASARVVKHSLIFGRILFKFAGHIQQMTISYMGYILNVFMHRAHVCKRARH